MQTEPAPLTNHTTLRWEDNIKMDLQEVGCDRMDWTDLAGTCEGNNEISGST
jgi:hypothetical protein